MGWLQRFFLNVCRSEHMTSCAHRSLRHPPMQPRSAAARGLCARCARCRSAPAQAERIKDLASIQGVRTNQLIGYGLVVGLDGTGDQTTQTPFTTQSLTTMLQQLGVTLPPGTNMQLKNVAAVMVTASCRRSRSRARPSTSRSRRWATPRACAAARC